jgi:hypothetical protein
MLAYAWEMYETNLIEVVKDTYMLSFAYKWLGESTVHAVGLPDFPGYTRDKENDKALVTRLWELMNDADIIVAHNGDAFDIKKANTRFIIHRLPPPEPSKTIDTLKLARKVGKFKSNKLDSLGQDLGEGRKLPHTGFHLWKGCMRGDLPSWKLMLRYNKQDVALLERVYLRFRPWAASHPNVTLYSGRPGCPKCGSARSQKRGFVYAQRSRFQNYMCLDCRGYFKGERIEA